MMKRYIPIITLVLLLVSCRPMPGMSLDEYDQLVAGLSYETVTIIAGSGGEMLPESADSARTCVYSFRGFGERGANATMEFKNGLLIDKSQQGLTRRQAPDNLQITYDEFIEGFLQSAILAAGGAGTGAISLQSYDYQPRTDGTALRTYTVWQSPEGGFVRLQALCNRNDIVISIETVYDSITGSPEADAVYLKCAAFSLQAYLMAKYSLGVMDNDLSILFENMLAQGGLGYAKISESSDGAVSTYTVSIFTAEE